MGNRLLAACEPEVTIERHYSHSKGGEQGVELPRLDKLGFSDKIDFSLRHIHILAPYCPIPHH